jgi:hypothetical protein
MRKSTISDFGVSSGLSAAGSWLNLEEAASVELSSEDPRFPFEQALRTDTTDGWKAAKPGPQLIRLRFDRPQPIRRVRMEFRETHVDRSQEIAIFATSVSSPRKELMRQQWTFSPHGSTTEVEDYFFDLSDVTVLEIEIDPGRHDKQIFASLYSLQIG